MSHPQSGAPARERLRLAGETSIAWAVFDPIWYLKTYPEIRTQLPAEQAEIVLAWYLDEGQKRGHSPNIFFDETWHRRTYPAITSRVAAQESASAFDNYCRDGFAVRSPHWLFDETLYRKRHPDMTDASLGEAALANGYDHFLRHGSKEGRIGHLLFDATFYCQLLEPDGAIQARAQGPFLHYLRRIETRTPEPRTSPYFNPAWYLARYPEVANAIAAGTWRSALQHYLCNTTPTEFDPLVDFSERHYLARNSDLAAAIARGDWRNGYAHFLQFGAVELRSPSDLVDLRWYVAYPSVAAALEQKRAANAFDHWLRFGRQEGLVASPPPDERVTEGQARTLYRRMAHNLRPVLARAPLDFSCAGPPDVSVIIVLHDAFAQTLLSLGSLRGNFAGAIELILIDSGSTDETRHITRYVRGARLLRFDHDIGRWPATRAAIPSVTANAVLLLAPDVELATGALAVALHCMAEASDIGAVGGKIVRPHGVLQEAGNIVWQDGTIQAYLRDAAPTAPEANFRRDVDFCSTVFLLLRAELLHQIDSFGDALCTTAYADADLGVRIAQTGHRVVYEPTIMVCHPDTAGAASRAAPADLARARGAFRASNTDWLATRREPGRHATVFARFANPPPRRVLFLDDTIPLRMFGSGFVRSNDLVRVMAARGYGVTVFPINPPRADPAAVFSDMPETAEVLYDRGINDLAGFLADRQGYYDVIWVARTHNLDRIHTVLQRAFADAPLRPRLVLDSEAIASAREAQRGVLEGGSAFDLDAAIRREFANAAECDSIVAVNQAEAARLKEVGFANVAVIGHMRTLQPTPRLFGRRAGMLFVGAMHRMDSPNYDSLCWFVDAVLPLVERALGWETRLTVVGYTAPGVVLNRFANHPRVTLRGELTSVEPLFDSHRLFVAPTRFAAGAPYKVHEAASFGLPVVATELLRVQLGWQDNVELLSADITDPELFARHIVALYRDETLWQRLRDAALERLARENNEADYAAAIKAVLDSGDAST